jgi:hypothetical protein
LAFGLAFHAATGYARGVQRGAALVGALRLIAPRSPAARKPGAHSIRNVILLSLN